MHGIELAAIYSDIDYRFSNDVRDIIYSLYYCYAWNKLKTTYTRFIDLKGKKQKMCIDWSFSVKSINVCDFIDLLVFWSEFLIWLNIPFYL